MIADVVASPVNIGRSSSRMLRQRLRMPPTSMIVAPQSRRITLRRTRGMPNQPVDTTNVSIAASTSMASVEAQSRVVRSPKETRPHEMWQSPRP